MQAIHVDAAQDLPPGPVVSRVRITAAHANSVSGMPVDAAAAA